MTLTVGEGHLFCQARYEERPSCPTTQQTDSIFEATQLTDSSEHSQGDRDGKNLIAAERQRKRESVDTPHDPVKDAISN